MRQLCVLVIKRQTCPSHNCVYEMGKSMARDRLLLVSMASNLVSVKMRLPYFLVGRADIDLVAKALMLGNDNSNRGGTG